MTSNKVEVEDVRARLQAGTSEEEARLLRKRLVRDVVLGSLPLASSLVFGELSGLSKGQQLFVSVVAVLIPVFFVLRYRRLGPSAPRVVPEAEMVKVARASSRCPGCGAVVLPAEAGECLKCGRIVKPVEALLIVGVFLAVVLGTILWRIYR